LGVEVIEFDDPLTAGFRGIDFAMPVGEAAWQDLSGEFFRTIQNQEKRHVGQL